MLVLIGVLLSGLSIFSSIHELRAQTKLTCRQIVFNCNCGNPGYVFQAHFKQCHYWLPPEQACTKFQNCLECESGVDICVSCPANRYGRRCTGVCQCKEGQVCNRDTGQCEGKGPVVPVLPTPSSPSCTPPDVESLIKQTLERKQGILKAIEYNCPDNYVLSGSKRITCNDGKWDSSPPKCDAQVSVISTPSPLSCIPPEVEPPIQQKLERRRGLVRAIEYSCPDYYILNGANRITCNDGKWDNDPPTCGVEGCRAPEVMPNGRIQEFIHPSGTRVKNTESGVEQVFPTGTIVIYGCNGYYKLRRRGQRTCLNTGKWDGELPSCLVDCGISESSNKVPTIINGSVTKFGSWPWQAALLNASNFIICGGSLITDKWILTAGHCVTFPETNELVSPSTIKVLLGKYYYSSNDEHVQSKLVDHFELHPAYTPTTYDSDIALIELNTPVKLSSRVLPVCVTTPFISFQNTEVGKSGVITGWGVTETGKPADVLKQTRLTIISSSECSKRHSESSKRTFIVTMNMFCAGVPNAASDVCSGDSGGPMVFDYEREGGPRWYQEGIVSWSSKGGCAQNGLYSGFTKVINFVPWMYNIVQDLP